MGLKLIRSQVIKIIVNGVFREKISNILERLCVNLSFLDFMLVDPQIKGLVMGMFKKHVLGIALVESFVVLG